MICETIAKNVREILDRSRLSSARASPVAGSMQRSCKSVHEAYDVLHLASRSQHPERKKAFEGEPARW